MKVFFMLMLGIEHLRTVSGVSHSLKYFYTGVSGDTNLPEFTAVGLVDHIQFMYFDSNTRIAVPKTEWIKKEEEPGYWESQTKADTTLHNAFKNNIKILKDRFNQSTSTGVHVVQWMYGCEWDEETGVTDGFDQFGYDGEDFISFNLETLEWIAPTRQGFNSKLKLDHNRAANQNLKNYFTQECIDWLKRYVDYGKDSLMRTVPLSVSLLQKTPSSPVTCHATGFYPRGEVLVTWKKDGKEQHEDVEHGETLPNNDGTFQKRVHLTVKPEEWKNHKYQCVVQVSGIQEDFIKDLTEDEIRINMVTESTPIGLIIGILVAAVILVVTAAVVGVKMYKKNSMKDAETDSDNTGGKMLLR